MSLLAEGADAAEDVAAAAATRVLETAYAPAEPVDLRATLGVLGRGPYDPTTQWDERGVWRTFRTPLGPATLRLEQRGGGIPRGNRAGATVVTGEVAATAPVLAWAWGPGAEWAIDAVPALLGADDDWSQLDVSGHPLLAEARRRHPGIRLTKTRRVFEALVPAVLEQKVTSVEAYRSWASLVTAFGQAAPGPAGRAPARLRVAPAAETWRRIPSWEWHRAGVDPRRSRVIVECAARADAIERTDATGDVDALLALPGIGPWTVAETAQRSHGDADRISVGDYHLAHIVGHALAGDRTLDDDGMLHLLAPWEGQRQRVIRLLLASGMMPERRGPRATITDHRRR